MTGLAKMTKIDEFPPKKWENLTENLSKNDGNTVKKKTGIKKELAWILSRKKVENLQGICHGKIPKFDKKSIKRNDENPAKKSDKN